MGATKKLGDRCPTCGGCGVVEGDKTEPLEVRKAILSALKTGPRKVALLAAWIEAPMEAVAREVWYLVDTGKVRINPDWTVGLVCVKRRVSESCPPPPPARPRQVSRRRVGGSGTGTRP